MFLWIFAFLIPFFGAMPFCWDSFDGREFFIAICFWAALLCWPIHWILQLGIENNQQREAEFNKRRDTWYTDMYSRGCKRTGFVGNKSTITPVWTCPDGTATLEPNFIYQ